VVSLSGESSCRQGEFHVFGSVDELQDGAGGLVVLFGLHAEDSCVTAGSAGVAFSKRTEEFRDECVGGLSWILLVGPVLYIKSSRVLERGRKKNIQRISI
jgi:hypothetical protein